MRRIKVFCTIWKNILECKCIVAVASYLITFSSVSPIFEYYLSYYQLSPFPISFSYWVGHVNQQNFKCACIFRHFAIAIFVKRGASTAFSGRNLLVRVRVQRRDDGCQQFQKKSSTAFVAQCALLLKAPMSIVFVVQYALLGETHKTVFYILFHLVSSWSWFYPSLASEVIRLTV